MRALRVREREEERWKKEKGAEWVCVLNISVTFTSYGCFDFSIKTKFAAEYINIIFFLW